jgi:hypothetical protein
MYKVPERDKKYGIGKRMGDNLYLHLSYAEKIIGDDFLHAWASLKRAVPWATCFSHQVVKWNEKKEVISFMYCTEFDERNVFEPAVTDVFIYYYDEVEHRKIHYTTDFPIYHHRWLMVPDDCSFLNVEADKERSRKLEKLINSGLFSIDTSRMGWYNYWNANVAPILNRMV